jgi:hypothetical protein
MNTIADRVSKSEKELGVSGKLRVVSGKSLALWCGSVRSF